MIEYTQTDHRFFDELIAFLASVVGIGTTMEVQNSGSGKAWREDEYVTLQGKSDLSGIALRFAPQGLYAELVANRWPSSIQFEERPLGPSQVEEPVTVSALIDTFSLLIQSVLLRYFERVRSQVESKYGEDTQSWPGVWNFGRVLRNAAGHGGRIHFRNTNAPSVAWRTLTYSPADNGRQVWLQDLAVVDTILLMADLDSAV